MKYSVEADVDFKVGDEVWYLDTSARKIRRSKIESVTLSSRFSGEDAEPTTSQFIYLEGESIPRCANSPYEAYFHTKEELIQSLEPAEDE